MAPGSLHRAATAGLMGLVVGGCSAPPAPSAADLVASATASEAHFQYSDAVDLFSQALTTAGVSRALELKALCGRGEAYIGLNQVDKAVADYTTAIGIDATYEDAYLGRAEAYRAKGDISSALSDATQAINQRPGDARAYVAKGGLYAFWYETEAHSDPQEDFSAAVTAFDTAIHLDPGSYAAYRARGELYKWSGEAASSAADLRRADDLSSAAGQDVSE